MALCARQAAQRKATAPKTAAEPQARDGRGSKQEVLAAKPRPANRSKVLSPMTLPKGSHSSPMLNFTTVCNSKTRAPTTMNKTSRQPKECAHPAHIRALRAIRPLLEEKASTASIKNSNKGATTVKAKKYTTMMALTALLPPPWSILLHIENTDRLKLRSSAGRMRFPRKPPLSILAKGRTAPNTTRPAPQRAATAAKMRYRLQLGGSKSGTSSDPRPAARSASAFTRESSCKAQ
mmetsp:Transcript_9262/g.23844  ORF Transcript_9262/g.23844 Transcript_9262/m.23844 type:complete len:235 (+) Transcript_9262:110-814(+)